MAIKVDPKSPVLWLRVTGIDKWRTVALYEVGPRTPEQPEPPVERIFTVQGASNNKVLPLSLTVSPDKKKLAAVALRVVGAFAPTGGGPMTVEFFQPKDAKGTKLPKAVETVTLKVDDDLLDLADVDLEVA